MVLKFSKCCRNSFYKCVYIIYCFQFSAYLCFIKRCFIKVISHVSFIEFTMGMILPTKAMAVQELTIKRKLSENALQVWPLVDDMQGGGKGSA